MKVAVECQSPLLQKSLEIFLKRYLSSTKHCDIIIRDEECLNDTRCFFVSSSEKADLAKPFSKSQLIISLEEKYEKLYKKKPSSVVPTELGQESLDFSILEQRIDSLTKEYQQNIIKAVKAFYEN